MPYAGMTIMGRQFVDLIADKWTNEKVKGTATAMAESALSIGAWHDNVEDGEISSRDCGLYQINIDASRIGTAYEAGLRTDSKDPAVFLPVARANVEAAWRLYNQPWRRDGQKDIRRWQPWVAYTSGWAMFPAAWAWRQIEGKPAGPWVPTGRYLHRAIRSVANWHYLIAKDMSQNQSLAEAKRLARFFGVQEGVLYWHDKACVTWHYPDAPQQPPADGVGPRPVKNDGR